MIVNKLLHCLDPKRLTRGVGRFKKAIDRQNEHIFGCKVDDDASRNSDFFLKWLHRICQFVPY